jgi:hypothetical protein
VMIYTNPELHIARLVSLHAIASIHSICTINHLDERMALVDIDDTCLNHAKFIEQRAQMSLRRTVSLR